MPVLALLIAKVSEWVETSAFSGILILSCLSFAWVVNNSVPKAKRPKLEDGHNTEPLPEEVRERLELLKLSPETRREWEFVSVPFFGESIRAALQRPGGLDWVVSRLFTVEPIYGTVETVWPPEREQFRCVCLGLKESAEFHRTPADEATAAMLSEVLPGNSYLFRYLNHTRTRFVDIIDIYSREAPVANLMGTVSLRVTPDVAHRYELALALEHAHGYQGDLLATSAFRLTDSTVRSGIVLESAVSDYFPRAATPHLLWTEHNLSPTLSELARRSTKKLPWLFAVPITDDELAFLRTKGEASLIRRFHRAQIDATNIRRPSIL